MGTKNNTNFLWLLSAFSLISSVSLIPHVGSAEDYYVSAAIGAALPNNKMNAVYIQQDNLTSGATSVATKKRRLGSSMLWDVSLGRRLYKDFFLSLEFAHENHKFHDAGSYDVSVSGVIKANNGSYQYKTKIRASSLFVNLNHRFVTNVGVTPYLALGAGISLNKVNDMNYISTVSPLGNTASSTDNINGRQVRNFAWQIGGGVLLHASQNIKIDASYKYRALGNVKSGVSSDINGQTLFSRKLSTSNFMLGVTYDF